MLGFPIPPQMPSENKNEYAIKNGNEVNNEDEGGSAMCSYLEHGERILDLTRKKSYHKKTVEMMEAIDILKLPYNQIPYEEYKQCDYFIKVIKRYVKRKLACISGWEAFQEEGLPFLCQLLGSYMDKIHVTWPVESESYRLGLCTNVFGSKFSVMIQFDDMPDVQCFCGIGNVKRKKSSYYRYKKQKQNVDCLVLDTEELIAYIALFNLMYKLTSNSGIDIMADYLRNRINEKMGKYTALVRENMDQLLAVRKPVSLSLLFGSGSLKHRKEKVPVFSPDKMVTEVFCRVLFDTLQLYQDLTYENAYRKNMKHESAPPYITKKNIPLKVLQAMKESKFNQYFGYVEFDEAMDMNAVKAIESEFQIINKEYFFGVAFDNVILRFRKLGRYKAGGLYYFWFNTLCVDIRCPDSYMHEYFHMIDDQLDDLSIKPDFSRVVSAYRTAFEVGMKKLPDAEIKELKGNNKYNKNYFFRRAEIFARCGEMFLNYSLQVNSSLLKSLCGNEAAYPDDQNLKHEIEIYYNKLFETLREHLR